MRTPLTVMAVLFAALLGLSFLTEGGEEDHEAAAAPVETIARRVEALRGLRFDELPRPERVSPEQAQRDGLRDLDRDYPEAQRRADEEILKLLGLIEPDVDLRDVSASLFGEGVAGYYDPRDGRLRTVAGAATGTRVLAEMVLAHELTHALEDQRFDLELEELSRATDDAALARLSLIEGVATRLMYAYVDRHFTAEEALGGVLGSAFQDTGDLPPFLQTQVVFPYLGGEAFVAELLRRAGGEWALVDTAYRLRPPSSTEQILHPEAYFEADEPQPVRLRAGRLLGDGWEQAAAGTWGELQTRELLARAGGGPAAAAEGWGGDRYELWRARAIVGQQCPAPCDAADVLLMRWRWDSAADEAEFAPALRAFAAAELGGRASAIVRRGGMVTLVLAPSASLAERLAREA
jgi:hypothetical protein